MVKPKTIRRNFFRHYQGNHQLVIFHENPILLLRIFRRHFQNSQKFLLDLHENRGFMEKAKKIVHNFYQLYQETMDFVKCSKNFRLSNYLENTEI